MPTRPAIGAGFDMAAQRRRAAGDDGAPDLGCTARQGLAGEIGRTEGDQHLGQTGRLHASRSGRQQLKRRSRTGQVGLRQMEVAHGRGDMAMAKQTLDGVDIDPGFQQMGGKAMA